ncbi:MAG: DUF4446 family protein [Candidatus Gastranaerophilales bacterium]|nr:DUF4446 family protein [Candidatus Gastranaerophilales bacterium]
MNTTVLEQMGLTGLDLGYLVIGIGVLAVLFLIVLILLIVQIRKTGKLKKRLDKFTTGKDGKSLEEDIATLFEDNHFLKNNVEKNRKDIRTLFKKMELAYQKMGLVKYDAFSQMGGTLSFCLAMLDENNNGFILNSVHSTEGCYSYTKEIQNGESALPLGKEEAEALAIATGENKS